MPGLIYKIFVCLLAGIGAGLGTGFAGMSAAAVIAPMLIAFLDFEPYLAVGVALASDVLASAVSAYTYKKNNNLDVKNGLVMMLCVLAFTVVGSFAAKLMPGSVMGGASTVMTLFLGVKFIIKPIVTTKEAMEKTSAKKRVIGSVVCGSIVGFICGFVGAGGGMMMLLLLTSVLGYELKTAVGTSVFIMTFTALTGAMSHFSLGGMPDLTVLALCVAFTLVFALVAAKIANKAKPVTLNRIVGVILVLLGAAILIMEYMVK
ncbi:MAG: sulfite exporter TauE/SafE family protein [Clostridia bacterium]|nr:sulfite exporter TauE/SafE family protein [Clostridia bacterium]